MAKAGLNMIGENLVSFYLTFNLYYYTACKIALDPAHQIILHLTFYIMCDNYQK